MDWEARVYVDGVFLGSHRGGYDAFSFDVTDLVGARDEHELVVGIYDPNERGPQPHGKQNCGKLGHAFGVGYACSSGIWQAVWLEGLASAATVPPDGFVATPTAALDGVALEIAAAAALVSAGAHAVEVSVDGDAGISWRLADAPPVLRVRAPARLWRPGAPELYRATVRVRDSEGAVLDEFRTYFGIRTISVALDARGVPRPSLNGAPVFQFGVLDQGFWPDGVYAPPSDAAIAFDVAAQRDLGFNAQRHHLKVESRRWYSHADALGLMVWQDMPAPQCGGYGNRSNYATTQDIYLREFARLVATRRGHPSIVQWDAFNEACATKYDHEREPDLAWYARVSAVARAARDGRLLDICSGCDDAGFGDVKDEHRYARKPADLKMAPWNASARRPSLVGEIGGFVSVVEDWEPDQSPGWANGSNVSGCLATAHWAGYEVFIGKNSREAMTAAAADLLGNIAGVINGTATVVAPLDGFYGVDGEAIDELEGTSLDGCGKACDALDACVAWDFADSCTRYGTLLSFSPRNHTRAGHKGFRRAGLSSAILTQSVDTETECDGLLTFDRRIAKYDREPLRAAARALVDAPL